MINKNPFRSSPLEHTAIKIPDDDYSSDASYMSCDDLSRLASSNGGSKNDPAELRTQTVYQRSPLSATGTGLLRPLGAENERHVCWWRTRFDVDVTTAGALLAARAAAVSLLMGIGMSAFGVSPRALISSAVFGGLGAYGVEAFAIHWDAAHRIAAAAMVPLSAMACTSSMGLIGAAAMTVAAGSYGPEVCAKIVQLVRDYF